MSDLLDLRQLIRVGGNANTAQDFPLTMPLKERIETVSDHLRRDSILSGPPGDKLQYLTLMAEFEYGFGSRRKSAADELAHAVKDLRQRFKQFQSQKSVFRAGDDPRVLRQEIWGPMAHAFYHDYCAGDISTAAKTLKDLKRVVTEELIPLEKGAHDHHGTRARLCELLAQCLRTNRHFDEARNQFLEAIELTEARLRGKHETPKDLESEQAFAIISTARLLGGLGRLAILRGQLSDALQMLRSAQTILDSVQNNALKDVIGSQILIAERRRQQPGSYRWKRQLKELEVAWEQFKQQGDHDGQRRCCYELGQAYIEQAELLRGEKRGEALQSADSWIALLEGISAESDVVNRNAELYRAHVLRAFRHLLAEDKFDGAAEHSRLAKESVHQAQKLTGPSRLDLAGCDCIDMQLVEGFEMLSRDSRRAVTHFLKVRSKAARENDAELELEAAIRAAQAELVHGNMEEARKYLRPWAESGERIENGFLRVLFSETAQRVKSRPSFEFSLEGWRTDMENAAVHYLNWALATGKTKKEAARLLRIDPKFMKRLLESHGIEST